jgi:hypothetical protein
VPQSTQVSVQSRTPLLQQVGEPKQSLSAQSIPVSTSSSIPHVQISAVPLQEEIVPQIISLSGSGQPKVIGSVITHVEKFVSNDQLSAIVYVAVINEPLFVNT